MKKILAIILTVISLSNMVACQFGPIWGPSPPPSIENFEWDGRFWYYTEDTTGIANKWYYIMGANPELGKPPENLETLFVPAEYKGCPVMYYRYCDEIGNEIYGLDITSVKELYCSYNTIDPIRFMGDVNAKYTKLVLPAAIFRTSSIETVVRSCSDNLDVFVPAIGFEKIYEYRYEFYERWKSDITKDKYESYYNAFNIERVNGYCFLISFTYSDIYPELSGKSFTNTIYKANTAFMFNYEDAPNMGYFFINDFERGGLIENYVYEPTREGYTFNGWYKDSECTQKWDFEVDTLPAPTYDENGQLEFIETKLYAGWIKI